RHTRSLRDWSSDVCSSDLFPFTWFQEPFMLSEVILLLWLGLVVTRINSWASLAGGGSRRWRLNRLRTKGTAIPANPLATSAVKQIGRASCRERVSVSEVLV